MESSQTPRPIPPESQLWSLLETTINNPKLFLSYMADAIDRKKLLLPILEDIRNQHIDMLHHKLQRLKP